VATKLTEPTSVGPRVTTFQPDARGNILTKTVTVGGESRTWTYTYNSVGQKLSEDGPRTDVSDVTSWTYLNGDLNTVTDAAGNVTTYSNYDAHGRPQTITDPNGLVTTLAYDPRGRLKSSSAAGETTAYDYDGVGDPAPDTSVVKYGYNTSGQPRGRPGSLSITAAPTIRSPRSR
jgi:YD repeat-containing protein